MLQDRNYRKPPLIEVFSDFYFDMGDDQEWDPKRLSFFADNIKAFGYTVEKNLPRAGPRRLRDGMPRAQRTANWPWRHGFASEDGNRTAQVGENLLVINQLPPYYGWQVFKQQALQCFNLYQSVWLSRRIVHAGLHYVDVVRIPGDSFFIDDFFNMYPVLPETVDKWTVRDLAMSCELQGATAGDVCSVEFHQRPSADPDFNMFRFRWDYVRMDGLPPEAMSVESWLDGAHGFLSETFRSTFTERCEQLFEPEE